MAFWVPLGALATMFSADPPPELFHEKTIAVAHILTDPHIALDAPPADLSCKLKVKAMGGTTPKFECTLESGETIKVKYGAKNYEVPSEIAAARLLQAVGFATDDMTLARRVRCFGCTKDPYPLLKDPKKLKVDWSRHTDFSWVSVERKHKGKNAGGPARGVRLEDLEQLSGATRTEKDALLLMAVLIQHWDDTAENQRLICLPKSAVKDESGERVGCTSGVLVMQDLGSSFGSWHAKYDPAWIEAHHLQTKGELAMNLASWRTEELWFNAARCTVLRPHGTYVEAFKNLAASPPNTFVISEAARALLAERLGKISAHDAEVLFRGSGVEQLGYAKAQAWAGVLLAKIAELQGARCPQ